MTFLINPYTQENHDIVYDICVKTADNGDDASHLHEDPKLIGHYFAGPYINLEPDSAFILNDENGPCGYIIGALDSASFYKKMRGVPSRLEPGLKISESKANDQVSPSSRMGVKRRNGICF